MPSTKKPKRVVGGSATERGMDFQARVSAIVMAHLIAEQPMGWLKDILDDTPLELDAETGGPGDDVRFLTKDRKRVELQAKRGLERDKRLWEALLPLAKGIADDHMDAGILAVCPNSSRTVKEELAEDIRRLGTGRTDNLRDIGRDFSEQLTAASLDIRVVCSRLRIVVINAVDGNEDSQSAARGHLARITPNTEAAWKSLVDLGRQLIRLQTKATPEQIYQKLFQDGVSLKKDKIETRIQLQAAAKTAAPTTWQKVTFDNKRDIGPALLGRRLGAAEAIACPRLPEADIAVRQLKTAFSARLVGDSGTGKSVCAFQVAYEFFIRGWQIFNARTAEGLPDKLPENNSSKMVLLVDDAHLLQEREILSLEGQAKPSCLILSTHNAIDERMSQCTEVRMNPKAGIRAIADGLLANREETLEAVCRADGHFGKLMTDVLLEERIHQAMKDAKVPWQFCFMLGGGSWRAGEAAHTAQAYHVGLPLAAIAIRQLASRDARSTEADIERLLRAASVHTDSLHNDLKTLANKHLISSADDLRCLHQRFAAAILGELFQQQDTAEIFAMVAMLKATIADNTFPLGGLGMLLRGLRLENRHFIDSTSLQPLIARCWMVNRDKPNDVADACYVLSETVGYLKNWEEAVIRGNESKLVAWVEKAANPMGLGLARVLRTLAIRQKPSAIKLTRMANPAAVSELISNADGSNVWHIAALVNSLRLDVGDPWAKSVLDNLDREKLMKLASSWPQDAPIHPIISLFEALVQQAEELTLDMVEAFLPAARERFVADPVEQFRFENLGGLAGSVLRVFDFFGEYKGKRKPSSRHKQIASALFEEADLKELAQKLSSAPLRKFFQVSNCLSSLHGASPRKFQKLVKLMNWDTIGRTIGAYWKHMPNDFNEPYYFQVILTAASTPGTQKFISGFIARNIEHMEMMPAWLVRVAPDTAVEFVRKGKQIAIANSGFVEWHDGLFIVELFAEKAPELLPTVLEQCISMMATRLSMSHKDWSTKTASMIEGMREHAPESLQKVLDLIDVEDAKTGWKAAWKAGGGSKKTVEVLLRSAIHRADLLGEFAVTFRLGVANNRVRNRHDSCCGGN